MANPFFSDFNTPFLAYPFDKITNEHYLPAFEEAIKQGLNEVNSIVENSNAPTFANTIEALEKVGPLLETVSSVFFNLNSAETSKEMQLLAKEISPKLSNYSNDIMLNDGLFKRVEAVYSIKDTLNLNAEQITLLDKTYKSFVRNGSKLNSTEKEQLRAIDKELSELTLTYSENVLAESNAFELVVTDVAELSGLPEGIIEAAKITANEKGKENAWVFTLDYPSYGPFMTYSDNRVLKEKMFKAYGSKDFQNNEHDNQVVLKKIASLRHDRAILLGYKSHADFVLEERMAKSPDAVFTFLDKLSPGMKSFLPMDVRLLISWPSLNSTSFSSYG